MTGAHPTYAELEHHRLKKKEKEPNDKTGVLYSEIKVDEVMGFLQFVNNIHCKS